MSIQTFLIRPFARGDEEAVYEVCLKTGDAGRDASVLLTDPKCLGHIYVGPYMRREPELAFVLCDERGICGYTLGTRDSKTYYEWFQETWLPEVRRSYAYPAGRKSSWSPTDQIVAELFEPRIHFPPSFAPYPAHLHIDLLPRAQGQGQGKRMIQTLLDKMRSLGVAGVHLVVAASNERARRFYEKLAFKKIDQAGENVYMAKEL